MEGKTLRIGRMALPDFTSWVQDSFLVATAGETETRIWASPRVKRRHGGWDDAVPRLVAEHLGWRCELLPCGVEAGNVLVDSAVVIGADVPTNAPEPEWGALREQLTSTGRRLVVAVSGASQPIFHIDLYLTLAGPHAVTGQPCALVGSVRQARTLLGQPSDPTDPDASLDAVAVYLAADGFAVDRLPLMPLSALSLPEAAWFSYNNCLVEVWRDIDGTLRRRVALPAYGADGGTALETLDAEAARVWRGLGFEVRFASGAFTRMAELAGSLRCMTKVLSRRDAP